MCLSNSTVGPSGAPLSYFTRDLDPVLHRTAACLSLPACTRPACSSCSHSLWLGVVCQEGSKPMHSVDRTGALTVLCHF